MSLNQFFLTPHSNAKFIKYCNPKPFLPTITDGILLKKPNLWPIENKYWREKKLYSHMHKSIYDHFSASRDSIEASLLPQITLLNKDDAVMPFNVVYCLKVEIFQFSKIQGSCTYQVFLVDAYHKDLFKNFYIKECFKRRLWAHLRWVNKKCPNTT